MDRREWLAERQAAVVASYDSAAATYDEHEYPASAQREWIARMLGLIQPGGAILDAPCGTGRYFPTLAAAGHRITGVDQSAGMLAQAAARGIACSLEFRALQNLPYDHEFDAVMTVDAMEHIPPEDWPLVLANVHRAVRPGGVVYLTVEEKDPLAIEQAFAALSARGLPTVPGEIIEGGAGGYHYYPGRDRAAGWLRRAGLRIVDEGYQQEDGWGYRHFLLRSARDAPPAYPG